VDPDRENAGTELETRTKADTKVSAPPKADPRPFLRVRAWLFGTFSRIFALLGLVAAAPSDDDGQTIEPESADRYRWLSTGGHDALFELSPDGRCVYASPNVEAITGHAPSRLTGRSIFEFIHPDDRSEATSALVAALTGGRSTEIQFRFRTDAGEYRWFEGYGRSVNRSPFKINVIAVARDITDRRRAEEAAHLSEERLMLHVEHTPLAVIGWDRDGKLVEWNPAAEAIFGYTRDEAIGRDGLTLLMSEATRDRWRSSADRRHIDACARRSTLENVTKDGRTILCEWHDSPLIASDGSVIGVTSIVEDATERVRAHEFLRDGEAAIRSLYELTSAQDMELEEKIEAVIAMGCSFFRMKSGIVARVEGQDFEIVASHNGKPGLERGAVRPMASMFSATVVARNETVAIDHASRQGWNMHPALREQGLETFIGTPVQISGRIFGVLSFASNAPRTHAFTEAEKDFLRLMAQWVGLAIERIQVEEELRHRALHDALTGLPNQRLLADRLQVSLAQAKRSGNPVAVCFIDLDRFKVVNDTLGHRIGDGLLKEVTARFAGCLREVDTLARLGGDEFVVILQDVKDAAAACDVAQRLLDSLSQPVFVERQEMFVTASIGVTMYPLDGTDVDTLIKNADRAMYRAKELGRDAYQLFSATDGFTGERFTLETALRHAIKNDELVLHYQPQIDIASGRIIAVEALVRWNHPERGLVSPVDFISLAEETGLIVPIGAWVIEEACRQSAKWRRLGFPEMRMAVNVSARQFRHKGFVDSVAAVLRANSLEPSSLEIELTESVTMHAGDAELEALQRLKFLGFRLAIDDFGTGYASLSNLKRFPIDTVKVDRSFVRDCLNSTDDAAIVKAVVSMGQALRLQVIAEGVETKEQLAFLQLLGCSGAQGYLIGRPCPAADIERLVAERWNARGLRLTPNPAA
jgi:diguanylate cyclase (GGDEF)-like protein/PAS domain S-box-containing protein